MRAQCRNKRPAEALDSIHDLPQMFEAMTNALALPGRVLQQNAQACQASAGWQAIFRLAAQSAMPSASQRRAHCRDGPPDNRRQAKVRARLLPETRRAIFAASVRRLRRG